MRYNCSLRRLRGLASDVEAPCKGDEITMKVTNKKLGGGMIAVEAVASTAEVSRALGDAQLMFAQHMGLRPERDRTVAQVCEERMGIKDLDAVVEAQAIEALIPYAVDKTGVVPAYPPQPLPKSPLKRGQTFQFELRVAVKPSYTLTSYEPVEITVAPFVCNEKEVDDQIAQLAEHYAEYRTDDPHAVRAGDVCELSLESSKGGQTIAGLTMKARTYATGMGLMPEEFDENIVGMDVGETKTFSFTTPGFDDEGHEIVETIECTATVNEIQKKVVPVIDDAWVVKNMPSYAHAAALRESISDAVCRQQAAEYENYRRNLAATELAKRFEGTISDEVYESMSRNLLNNVRAQVQQQHMTWEQFIEQQGGEQQFNMMAMMQTRQMLVQGYALDALFEHEGLAISDEDIMEACSAMDPQNPQGVRRQMEESGRGFALREAAERIRANKWLVEHAKVTVQER